MLRTNQNSLLIRIGIGSIGLATTSIITYYLKRTLSQYGVEGTLRLLWEGDHLPYEIRESMDELEDVNEKFEKKKFEAKIDQVEIVIQKAFLDSSDDDLLITTTTANTDSSGNNDVGVKITEKERLRSSLSESDMSKLKRDIGGISYELDKIAGDIGECYIGLFYNCIY